MLKDRTCNALKLIIFFVMTTILLTSVARGQCSNKQSVFAPIPKPFRARLINRLDLYVKYQRTQEYVKWAELLSDSSFQGQSRPSKAEYLKYQQEMLAKNPHNRLLKFIPKCIEYIPQLGAYEIRGQAWFGDKGERVEMERVVYAWLEKNEWYFSGLAATIVD